MLETPRNTSEKTLAVLVLDRSGSMGGCINELNQGVNAFLDDIRNDARMDSHLEVSIITFDDEINVLHKPDLARHIDFKDIRVGGLTGMVDAVRKAIEIVEDRKSFYKANNIKYKLPWIILMTDGGETEKTHELPALAYEIETLTKNQKFMLIPIAIDRAACGDLETIAGYKKGANGYERVQPVILGEKRFAEFFEWLSASMSVVSNAADGQNVTIQSPVAAGWGTFSTTSI